MSEAHGRHASGPDWSRDVRSRLDLTGLSPARQLSIVRDVAAQLEECYRDAVARGATPEAAEAETRAQITDWKAFSVSVTRAAGPATKWDLPMDDIRPLPGTAAGRLGFVMNTLAREVRLAIRSLVKRPGFSAMAVLTLGLGVGATTAIFGVVRGVLVSPLPYADPDRLVVVWAQLLNRGVPKFPVSPPDLRDYQAMTTIFSDIAGVFAGNQTMTDGDAPPEQVQMAAVTPTFHQVAGIAPLFGRGFLPSDAAPIIGNAAQGPQLPDDAVILGYGLWQRRFGGSPDAVGRTIELDGTPRRVVGVMPATMRLFFAPSYGNLPSEVDVWTTPRFDVEAWGSRRNVAWSVMGRLQPGVSLGQAQAALDEMAVRLKDELEVLKTAGYRLSVTPLRDELTAEVRPVLLTLLAAVGVVLLIACANVANLLLVRASTREREIAVRTALGASRGRIVGQLLVESLGLGLGGAVVGAALAFGGLEALVSLRPANLPRLDALRIDGVTLGFTTAVALLSALLFGIVPALRASSPQLASVLTDRGQSASGHRHRVFRDTLVVVETVLAVVLLVGSGLMVRSFVTLLQVNPGFDPRNLLTFEVSLPTAVYNAERSAEFSRRFTEQLESIPGVTAVSAALGFPFQKQAFGGRYGPEAALADESLYGQADYRIIRPGYFTTMGTRVIAGRVFSDTEHDTGVPVAVIDDAVARAIAPGGSAVGRRLVIRTGADPATVEVIGVVEHERAHTLSGPEIETVYLTDGYIAAVAFPVTTLGWLVRTTQAPMTIVPDVRQKLASLDGQLPPARIETMEAKLDEARTSTRFALVLIGAFGAVGLILTSVGLYGVLASVVRHKTAEIGLRIALGARPGSVVWMVVRQGLGLTVAGLAGGLLVSAWATQLMTNLLVGVAPNDPATLAGIVLLFLIVAAAACYVPARRATLVDPLTALRAD